MERGGFTVTAVNRWAVAALVCLTVFVLSGPTAVLAQQNEGQSPEMSKQYKPAVLKVVTNFSVADVTVNGLPYPEYVENTDKEGMVLPAGGPHTVEVTYDGKKKTYQIGLEPYRVRILMVELTGFKGGNVTPGVQQKRKAKANSDESGEYGQVTVYSKPQGAIIIDGDQTGQDSPGTVKVEPGRHDVKIQYNDGEESETKTVRVRKGQRLKLFFRSN
jgi:hypothetical protein